jgi:hypothetical protein
MAKTFKHSGALGDLIYSLPIVKHFGGGGFYLHLNQIDWIGQHYYGSPPNPFHQGRLTHDDYLYMRDFMLAQTYITEFEELDPKTDQITHNLDRFRVPFVGHPGNYVDIYSSVFNLTDEQATAARTTPWLTVPGPTVIDGRTIVINRTQRWLPPTLSPVWAEWKDKGVEAKAIFVGLEDEYVAFKQQIGWDIPWAETQTMLELAQIIDGSEAFIGNQSQALAIAIGLGKKYACERRQDLPIERNECFFPNQPGGSYF